MFHRKKKPDPGITDTLVGEGSVFDGSIKSNASVRIEGVLAGDIQCEGDVTIGENSTCTSNIQARNMMMAGKVTGNVTVKGTLTILATGQLYGNIQAKELVIAHGAIFIGQSTMELSDPEQVAHAAQSEA